MKKLNRSSRFYVLLAATIALTFSVGNAQTVISGNSTTKQTLTNGQTLTVTSTGNLSTTSGTLVTINGSSTLPVNQITITNSGSIKDEASSGGGRAIRDQSGGSNSVINNNAGGLIQAAQNDVIVINVANVTPVPTTSASVMDIENAGTIQSLDAGGTGKTIATAKGNQALNLTVATGATTVNNKSTGVIWATAADAVRPGLNGVVYNDGFIYSNQYNDPSAGLTSSDGIDAQGNTGITIVNGYTTTAPGGTIATYQSSAPLSGYAGAATAVAMTESTIEGGRHGITGGNTSTTGGATQLGGYTGTGAFSMSVTNNQGGLIEGQNGSGINLDGFGIQGTGNTLITNENVSVTNYGQIVGNGISGDGDGVDIDGDVTINNQGSIISKNSTGSAGSIEFSEGVTVGGGTIVNGSSTKPLAVIEGEVANGNTTAVGRGITLAGIDHDASDVDFPIQSIYENSSLTNSGLIKGDTESGLAVLGTTGGGYTVTVTNNATGTIEGNNSGVSERSNVTYNGSTGSNGQSLNQGAIELDDAGNSYVVTDYGTIKQDGASGMAVEMHSSISNALNIDGGSATIIGGVAGDTAADSTLTINPGSGGTFTYNYGISNFAVQINADGANGAVKLTSTSSTTGPTTVNAGKLDVSGSIAHSAVTVKNAATFLGDGSAGATHVLSGGTVAAGDAATMLAATQAASVNFKLSLGGLTLDGNSTLSFTLDDAAPGTGTTDHPAGGTMFDLGLTGVFAAGASVTPGSILLNFNNSEVAVTPAAPNVYELAAFAPATTVALSDFKIENLSVDGAGATSLSYVLLGNGQEALDLTVAPEPGTCSLVLAGLALLPWARRRIQRA